MDVRAVPYPGDLPVISEPGGFYGWVITIELSSGSDSITIDKQDTAAVIAEKLRKLASDIETDSSN